MAFECFVRMFEFFVKTFESFATTVESFAHFVPSLLFRVVFFPCFFPSFLLVFFVFVLFCGDGYIVCAFSCQWRCRCRSGLLRWL